MRALAFAAALLAVTSSAVAAPALQPDDLTVSGRHALPKADASLQGRLRIADLTVAPEAARQMKVKPEAYQAALRSALEKSLRNYGYLAAPDAADAIALTVEAPALLLKPEEKATAAAASLRVAVTGEAPACLAHEAKAEFTALSPSRSGAGQRAFAIVAGITLAALTGPAGGGAAGNFIGSQLNEASARNAALNAERRAYGEAVAPYFDRALEARFAGVNATQLAVADYIAHLGEACRGDTPSAPAGESQGG